MPARKSAHSWQRAGTNRERCSSCRAIRSWQGGNIIYCQIGGDQTTRDPGCFAMLPGVLGAAFVDGETH
jgi:hypothetical protein